MQNCVTYVYLLNFHGHYSKYCSSVLVYVLHATPRENVML